MRDIVYDLCLSFRNIVLGFFCRCCCCCCCCCLHSAWYCKRNSSFLPLNFFYNWTFVLLNLKQGIVRLGRNVDSVMSNILNMVLFSRPQMRHWQYAWFANAFTSECMKPSRLYDHFEGVYADIKCIAFLILEEWFSKRRTLDDIYSTASKEKNGGCCVLQFPISLLIADEKITHNWWRTNFFFH